MRRSRTILPRPARSLITRPRRAFTLIEILITVGIILILMGLVLVGLKRVTAGAHGGSTRATLGTAKGLLNEYFLQVKSNRPQPASIWGYDSSSIPKAYPTGTTTSNFTPDLWKGIGDANTSPPPEQRGGVKAPGVMEESVIFPPTAGGVVERYSSPAVRNTGLAMFFISKVPANRKVLDALAADRQHVAADEWKTGTQYSVGNRVVYNKAGTPPEIKFYVCVQPTNSTVPGTDNGATWREAESTLLDSWGNPIIFVPSDGLQLWWDWNDVKQGKPGTICYSANKFMRCLKPSITPPDTTNWEEVPPAAAVIKSPDGKPFFASAGPDGDFRTTDDNLYSFED
jgi:prepilin-type N-terminal cleavage/methylation domain-containing protein